MLGFGILALTPLWETERPIILASWFEATRLRREEGWHELSEWEALRAFDCMDGWAAMRLRSFVSEADLSSFPLSEVDDYELVDIVREAIQSHRAFALRKGDGPAAAPSPTTLRRHLVREIEAKTRGRLSYSGRQYKLVVDVDLDGLSDREYHEVVRRDDAKNVLDGLAADPAMPIELLAKASADLTKDWRKPFSQPDGIILLRRNPPSRKVATNDEPAITPSQMRALLEKGDPKREKGPLWVRIDVTPEHAQQMGTLFVLTSSDQSIAITQTAKDDMVAGNETVDLLYEDLWKDLSYSLRIDDGPGASDFLFDTVPYAALVSLAGSEEDTDTTDDGADSEEPEAVRSVGLAGLDLFLDDGEDT